MLLLNFGHSVDVNVNSLIVMFCFCDFITTNLVKLQHHPSNKIQFWRGMLASWCLELVG